MARTKNVWWYNTGLKFEKVGIKEKAVEFYLKAIEEKLDFHQAWNNLGNAYNSTGNLVGAINCYKKTIELEPNLSETWANLGVIYDNLNLMKKIIRHQQI